MLQQDVVFTVFKWLLTGASIVGVVFNVRKDRTGFLIWIFTNASWAIVDFVLGIPQQGVLFSVYFLLAVWGYFSWSKEEKTFEKRVVKAVMEDVNKNGVIRQAIKKMEARDVRN